jgi:hypothetical protein
MDSRHKNKAITGTAVWFAAIPLVLTAHVLCKKFIPDTVTKPDHTFGLIFLLFMLVQYLAFFWGGNHLAKAKGYSNALLMFGIFWPAQLVTLTLLLFALPDKCPHSSSQTRKKKHSHDESQIGRIVRFRRNALVANALGVFGILLALSIIFVPIGFFASRDNACVTAIFIFIPSYAAILNGCWSWVRAKNWPGGVIFIGLMPLALPFIPYVRLIYRVAPLLLPASMVMMPIVLIVVVAGLPDKSGMSKRKRWNHH